jgi:thioredoxin-related protein/cell division protein FtsN
MNKLYFTLMAVGVCLMFAFQPVDKQAFIMNDFISAKAQAAKEQKLLLVHFTARWCTPCQVMEQNTWTHPDLITYMNEHCVAGKIDIENFDGMSYTQEYRVKNVPTILVFSADGRQLGRYENSISATHLITYLSKFNTPENRVGASQNQNGSSAKPDGYTDIESEFAQTTKPSRTLTSILEEYGLRKAETAPETWSNGESALIRESLANAVPTESTPEPEPLPQTMLPEDFKQTASSLEQDQVAFVSKIIAPQTTTFPENQQPAQEPDFLYTVQCGAFNSKSSADKQSKQVRGKLKNQTWVLIPQETHDKYYRVITGTFYSRDQADAHVYQLKANGLDGFVRIMPSGETLAQN